MRNFEFISFQQGFLGNLVGCQFLGRSFFTQANLRKAPSKLFDAGRFDEIFPVQADQTLPIGRIGNLGGGFIFFLKSFHPYLGKMNPFWLAYIFQMGWFNHQLGILDPWIILKTILCLVSDFQGFVFFSNAPEIWGVWFPDWWMLVPILGWLKIVVGCWRVFFGGGRKKGGENAGENGGKLILV